jgi:hypothetical protein
MNLSFFKYKTLQYIYRIIYFVVLAFFIFSCNGGNNPFYSYYAEEDLYRVPLIKPYQLINLYGVEEDNFPLWQMDFHYGGDKNTPGFNSDLGPNSVPGVSATEINVTNGVIYGHSPKNGDYPDVWFAVIPERKIEKVFKGKETEWIDFLKRNSITNIQMYPVWNLFRKYKDTYTLPWYDPKKNVQPE